MVRPLVKVKAQLGGQNDDGSDHQWRLFSCFAKPPGRLLDADGVCSETVRLFCRALK